MLNDLDRRALRSVGLQFLINGVVFASFIPRLPEIRDRLGVDLDTLGLLLTLGSLGGIVGSALVGRMMGPLGTKRSMTIGSIGLVSALPFVGLAETPWVFLLALVAMQGFDVITDVAMNLQGSWLSDRRHTPVMNRLHGLWSLGTVAGGLVAALVAGRISLTTHLFIVAGILFATALYVVPGLLAVDEHVDDPPDESGVESEAGRSGWRRRLGGVGLAFGVMATLAAAIEIIPSDWAALRLVDDFGVAEQTAALGYVGFTSGMVTGRFSGDWLTVRLGAVRFTRLTIVVATFGIAIATLAPTTWLTVVGSFIAGCGVAAVFPRLYDDSAKAPGRPGVVLGAMTAGIRFGLLLAPVAVGALAETSLSVGSAMAIVAIPAGLMLLVIRERSVA